MDQLPDIVAMEIVRRLPASTLTPNQRRQLAKLVGVHLDPVIPDEFPLLEPRVIDRKLYRGTVEFDIAVSGLGETHKLRCRMVYAMTLGDDEDADTGGTFRVVEHGTSQVEALVWDEHEAQPHWLAFDERLLPILAVNQLDELTVEDAVAQERAENRP